MAIDLDKIKEIHANLSGKGSGGGGDIPRRPFAPGEGR